MELTGSVSGNINLGGSGGGGLDDVLVKKTTDYESVVENDKAYIDLSWVASKTSLADYVTLEDMADYYDKIEVNGLLNQKQDKLIVLGTARGKIASFEDGADEPMPTLKVGIEPIQEGSGDPSPTNIRPISGHTEANIVVSPTTDAEDGATYTIDLDGTRYGGTLDVVSGVLTVDRAAVVMNGKTPLGNFQESTVTARAYYQLSNMKPNSTLITKMMCDKLKVYRPDYIYSNDVMGVSENKHPSSNGIWIRIDKSFLSNVDLSGMNAWLNDNNTTVVYELATPTTIQLTPTQVKSLQGTNNIWADTGDVVEAVYVRDFKKVIDMLVDKSAYSKAEKQIGTWIDGKKLYRRTFILTASNLNNSPFTTDIPSNIIDNIWIDASATFIKTADNSGNYITAVGYWNPANNFDCRLHTNEQYIELQTWHNGGMSYQDGSILTLLYTKVND